MRRGLWLLIVIITCFIFFPDRGGAYFEDRYFCAVGSSSITVSLKQSPVGGEKKCFEYVSKVASKINILESDIAAAQGLITAGRDVPYWTEVRDRLQSERDQYMISRNQLIVAMNDFERELFIRVKSIIYVYLHPTWDELDEKLEKTSDLLALTKLVGNIEQYSVVVQKHDQIYTERLLHQAIRTSTSFEQLVVPLRAYFKQTNLSQ